MPRDMIGEALARLAAQLAAHAARTVRYERGGRSVQLPATCGKKLLKLDAGGGRIEMRWTDMDFCLPAASLAIAGEAITPEEGDLIHVDFGAGTEIYEVAPYGPEPHWRWCDHVRAMLRVHTKHVETEDGSR